MRTSSPGPTAHAAGLALVDGDGEIEVALPMIQLGRRASRDAPCRCRLPIGATACPASTPTLAPLSDRLERHAMRVRSPRSKCATVSQGMQATRCPGYRHDTRAGIRLGSTIRSFRPIPRQAEVAPRRAGGSDRTSVRIATRSAWVPLTRFMCTRRRLGVPVQPRRFFEVLWDEFQRVDWDLWRPRALVRSRSPRWLLGPEAQNVLQVPRPNARSATSGRDKQWFGTRSAGGAKTVIATLISDVLTLVTRAFACLSALVVPTSMS